MCSAAFIFVSNNQIALLLPAEYRFENSAKTACVRIISCAGEPTDHAFQTNQPKECIQNAKVLLSMMRPLQLCSTHALVSVATIKTWGRRAGF